jgi:hypothetical protein
MVIYEVNQEMDAAVFEDFKKWFAEIHVPEMLAIDGFVEARILANQDVSDDRKRTACCYLLKSQNDCDRYIENHAAEMTRRLTEKFGARVLLTRRVFTVLQTIQSHSM